MSRMANLPDEIMVEIFTRLPTKSVGKCRCLSKSWNSHLSTSQFINSHLVTHKNSQENIILITPSHSIHTITITSLENNAVFSRKLDLQGTWTQIWGSCNGLVLLENEAGHLYLVNPVTLQKVKIPEFDLALKESVSNIRAQGFGYDTCSDDYKIVTLSSNDTFHDDTFVDVYSVKTGVWKRIGKFPYDHHYASPVCGAFVNGAIHWRAATKFLARTVIPLHYGNEEDIEEIEQPYDLESPFPPLIVAFDLASEVFYEVPAPCAIDDPKDTLVVLGGHLCLVDAYSGYGCTDIWTMEEYGAVETWTRKFGPAEYDAEYEVGDTVWDTPKPLCFVGEDEVLVTTFDMFLMVHNMNEQTSRYLVIDGVHRYSLRHTGTFVDSLVSVG